MYVESAVELAALVLIDQAVLAAIARCVQLRRDCRLFIARQHMRSQATHIIHARVKAEAVMQTCEPIGVLFLVFLSGFVKKIRQLRTSTGMSTEYDRLSG